MKSRPICVVLFVLWVVTIVAIGWLFVKGWTAPSSDGRTEVLLAPPERDMVLAEMRALLKAVHGVIGGLGDDAQSSMRAAQSARAAGMHMAADADPALMAKLPLPFKQMGMSVHRDMDGLADAITRGETSQQILNRLAGITARCTTCHDMYRFGTEQRG
jgi:hypothetical protein